MIKLSKSILTCTDCSICYKYGITSALPSDLRHLCCSTYCCHLVDQRKAPPEISCRFFLLSLVGMYFLYQTGDHNYDFVSIDSDGTVKQGRLNSGESTVLEEGTADVSQPLFVRVVGNGTHFRGYINQEMVAHGHGNAPEPGSIGLKLDGSGTFLLQKMSVTQL